MAERIKKRRERRRKAKITGSRLSKKPEPAEIGNDSGLTLIEANAIK
jgi:hypothetical protein